MIESCSIENNYAATTGGGIYFDSLSTPVIRATEVVGNSGGSDGASAGIYCADETDIVFVDCVIRANLGTGVTCVDASVTLVNCRLEDNAGERYGGGVNAHGGFPLLFDGCWISGNSALFGGGIAFRGAWGFEPPPFVLRNCTIVENRADFGSALWLYGIAATIENCTIIENRTMDLSSAGIHWGSDGSTTLLDCILRRNSPQEVVPVEGDLTVDYCDLSGGWPTGGGNMDLDPLFCDADCGLVDLLLAADSPCLGSAHDGGDIGAWGLGCLQATRHVPLILDVPSQFSSVAEAIAVTCAGDTVRVAPGTYLESGLGFGGRSIVVTGTAPLDSAVVAATVIDGAGARTPVFRFDQAELPAALLTGVTITGGSAEKGAGICCFGASPTVAHCIVRDNHNESGYQSGGGVYCEDPMNLHIRDTLLEDNSSDLGGGISCRGGVVEVERCVIRDNSATFSGGGVRSSGTTLLTRECLFVGNSATDGGGLNLLLESYRDATMIRCDLLNNHAQADGGGIRIQGTVASDVTLSGLRCVGNSATRGGAIDWDTPVAVYNSLFLRNDALGQGGGAIYSDSYDAPLIENCTFSDNQGGEKGGAFAAWGVAYPTEMRNCIVWGNSMPEIGLFWDATLNMNYSCIAGGWPGEGNLDQDPLFAPPRAGFEVLLRPGSPCVDSGDPGMSDAVYDAYPHWPAWFPNGVRADMGAYGGPGNDVWLPQ
jgi:predicted outer membrane repeat protein